MSVSHAFCPPSDWEGWSNCPGKPALEEGEPDVDSPDAAWGQQCHTYAADLLRQWRTDPEKLLAPDIPADMREWVWLYVDAVRERIEFYRKSGARVQVFIERALDISAITTEKDAKGTADAVILAVFEDHAALDVWDAKFGIGVKVKAEGNGQLQIYALAALLQHSLLTTITEVNLVIHQPRVRKEPQEWQTTPESLYIFGSLATAAATLCLSLRGDVVALSHLKAGEPQCRFCRVKYRCPELLASIHREVYGEFQKIEDPRAVPVAVADKALTLPPADKAALLGKAMRRVPLIESWCLAVRAAVEDAMLNEGLAVEGFKIVQGRRGVRTWGEAPDTIMTFLEGSGVVAATYLAPATLLSPAQLELKLPPDVWALLSFMVKQSPGKPSVALIDDPRPPWTGAAERDEFDTYSAEGLV